MFLSRGGGWGKYELFRVKGKREKKEKGRKKGKKG